MKIKFRIIIDDFIWWYENNFGKVPFFIRDQNKYFCGGCGLGIWHCDCDWNYL